MILKHEDLQVNILTDENCFEEISLEVIRTLLVEGKKNVRKQLILEQNCSIHRHNGDCSHV